MATLEDLIINYRRNLSETYIIWIMFERFPNAPCRHNHTWAHLSVGEKPE
jgi:hypothetical protein